MFGSLNPWVLLGGGLAALALILGVFFYGKDVGETNKTVEYQAAEIVQLEEDLAEERRIKDQLLQFQETTEQVSQQVSDQVIERTNTITEVRYVNQPVIEEVFRDTGFLSQGWVYAHDALANGEEIDPIRASDETPSRFTEADSLRVIGNNYGKAGTTAAQVDGWIDFYDGVRDANDSVQPTDRTDEVDSSSTTPTGSTSSADAGTGTAGND